MIASKGLFIGIVITAGMAYMFYPWLAVFLIMMYAGVLMMAIKMYHLDVFLTPLKRDEVINLFVTKTKKIIPQINKEMEEGYIGLTSEWGTIKNIPESDYKFNNRPTVISLQGVSHTIKLEYAKIAEKMKKIGVHSAQEAATFLDIPIVDLEIGKEIEYKPGGEVVEKKEAKVEEKTG